jgi:hypothetical protein
MDKGEFINYLENNPGTFEWSDGEHDGKTGVFVKNNQFETVTHFTDGAIENNNLKVLINQTTHGKNIEHITRVTGFFSKVQSWNKGKIGELKERHRAKKLQ